MEHRLIFEVCFVKNTQCNIIKQNDYMENKINFPCFWSYSTVTKQEGKNNTIGKSENV